MSSLDRAADRLWLNSTPCRLRGRRRAGSGLGRGSYVSAGHGWHLRVGRDLYLELTIGAPRFSGSAGGQFAKTMMDGVLTALHAHADRESIDEITNRLRARLHLTAPEIQASLLDDQRAVLGARRRLLVLRGRGVQCRPDDIRVAALKIMIDRYARSWSITGRLCG